MRHSILLYLTLGFYFAAQSLNAVAQSFTSSNLPIIVLKKKESWQQIDSSWDGFELRVEMGVIDNPGKRNHITDPFTFRTDVSIKRQGSSTVGLPKKSYRITTLDAFGNKTDVPLLGFPEHEDWILKALYQDKSLLRDDLAYKIYRDMGHYSSRSRFFEMVVDGDYRGVYHLLEKIKRNYNRVSISKMTQGDVSGEFLTGGYIISLDKFVPGVDKGWHSKYKSSPNNDSANFFLYVYPRPDSIVPQQMNYIRNYVDQFEDALVSSGGAGTHGGYDNFIDLPSFVDNFILTELSRNVDGYRSSTFFHKDRQSMPNSKLKAGPVWDFNLGFGNCVNNFGNDPHGWAYDQRTNVNFIPFWWKKFMSDSVFRNELRCRYQELRKNVLSENTLIQYIDKMATLLDEAQARNFQRFPILAQNIYPTPTHNPPAYASETGYLKWWLRERLNWMDQQLSGSCVVSLAQNDPKSAEMQVSPNPFVSDLHIAYKTPEGAYVKIELLSLSGGNTLLIAEGRKKEGVHEERISAAQLPSGAYVLKLGINTNKYYLKVIKLENN